MKTSALIQSLSRWISEIATRMIWRCFKAKGKSSLLLKSTNLPFTLYCTFSHHLSSSSSFIPVSLSLPHSLFLSIWHPEMNRCCHWDSCSLSAFKQTVSKRITFTGNLPVWGEVISSGLLCSVQPRLWQKWGIWPHSWRCEESHTLLYCTIHSNCMPLWVIVSKIILVALSSLLSVLFILEAYVSNQMSLAVKEEAFYMRALSFPPV